MSLSSGIDPATGKIYQDLIPAPLPANINLSAVLTAGNSAGNQSATDFNDIGCISLETGKVYQGNNLSLQVGEAGDTLQILGATAKGSFLVGNGANTEEFSVGLNGKVLTADSTAPLGVSWTTAGGGGGGVVGVSAGTNIDITGTLTNPIVNVVNPVVLTNGTDTTTYSSTGVSKSVGASTLAISSTTSTITLSPNAGSDCNVVVSGTGSLHATQSSTGGATQPALIVENTNGNTNAVHLDLYKNSSSPATNDGIAGLSYHANNANGTKVEYARIQADQRDITAGSENGSVSVFVAQNSATTTEYFRFDGLNGVNKMYKFLETQGNYIQNTAAGQNLTLFQNQNGTNITFLNTGGVGGIQSTCSNGQFGVSSNSYQINASTTGTIQAVGPLYLTSFSNVIVPQNGSTQPRMTTEIANVNYYPSFVADNQNLNNVSIPPPAIQGQRMTLINKGVSPTSSWNDITAYNAGTGIQVAYRSSNGYVWIAPTGSNYVSIYNETLTTLQGSFYVGSSGGGGQQVYCMLEDSGYMYIGGDFASINGNAQAQVGMARVSIYSPFAEDIFYDGMGGINGIQYGGIVYDIEAYGGYIYFGGSFTSFSNSSPCFNICSITNVSYGSTQYDWCNGGVDGAVYALLGAGSYLFVGGAFSYVYYGVGAINYQRLATYSGGVSGTWDYTGGNAWNGDITTIQYTNTGQYIFVGGSFTNSGQPYNCYIDYNSPNSGCVNTNLSIADPLQRNASYYNGATYISTMTNGVYSTNSFQVWTSNGIPKSGYNPSYMGYFNGQYVVAYTNYSYFLDYQVLNQNATFTLTSGQFKFNNATYSSVSIVLVDVGWDFIGDLSSSPYTWRQTSYNPWGSYS